MRIHHPGRTGTEGSGALGTRAQNPPVLHESGDVPPAFRKIRGTKERSALLGRVPAADSVIFVSLRVSGDASRAAAETRQMIAYVGFDAARAEVAPTPPRSSST